MKPTTLGICMLGDCLTQAQWVHGERMKDADGNDAYTWELCDCCHESVVAADRALDDAGIPSPDSAHLCIEACRARLQRLKKLEALKK